MHSLAPPASAKEPAKQGSQEPRPTPALNVPGVQSMHVSRSSDRIPAPQEQSPADVLLFCRVTVPVRQGEQKDAPDAEKELKAHTSQDVKSKLDEYPAPQAVQFSLACIENLPAPQLMQAMEAVGANLPGPQASQEVASEVEERPALHVVQFALA